MHDALRVASHAGANVVGLPTTNEDGTWVWPVHSMRESHRSVQYAAYPTGYPNASGYCAIGDTTSGTRAYKSALLASLLQGTHADSASTSTYTKRAARFGRPARKSSGKYW